MTTLTHPRGDTFEASYYRTLAADGPSEELHAHDEATTIVVLEGIVYLVSEDDERAMTPGDEAIVPAGVPHRLFNAGHGLAHVLEHA
jgi:quercetin dioxygenase-like cupin family protein